MHNDAPSVNIPINFEVGTTTVDERTRANIAILAGALSDPANAQQHFIFVGHADVRGVEPNNLAVQVSALRKVLGPESIATIPGRGYRFSFFEPMVYISLFIHDAQNACKS